MLPTLWPAAELPPQSIMFDIENVSRSGGVSINGSEQIVSSSTGRWKARLTTKITRADQALAYRAVRWHSRGRARTWIVPTCSGFQVLGPPIRSISSEDEVPFSDTATFSDLSEFGAELAAQATTAGTIGATSLTVQMDPTTPPTAGQYFSLGEADTRRLYGLSSVQSPASGTYILTFEPGLRAAVAIGDSLDFSTPSCLMRLATDASGAMDLDLLRFASVSLDFVEAF